MVKYKLLTQLQDENNKLHEIGDTITLSKEKAQPLIANGTIAELDEALISELEDEGIKGSPVVEDEEIIKGSPVEIPTTTPVDITMP